ncbi:MAG: DUF302 domain-containing protein [Chloroflexi bacterium]|nr:DUF302 domain-containing protein [Chloroflexota bacterium]MDA1296481.1 DUF302 domain-containing protein [Chloroflexota bacterium]
MEQFNYGKKIKVPLEFDSAVERIVAELKANGFGILTEIDVKETLKVKIGEDFKRYVILGACNPKLAFKALSAEEDIGLLLPCNIVVYEQDGGSVIGVLDPGMMSSLTNNPVVAEVAAEAGKHLDTALGAVASTEAREVG